MQQTRSAARNQLVQAHPSRMQPVVHLYEAAVADWCGHTPSTGSSVRWPPRSAPDPGCTPGHAGSRLRVAGSGRAGHIALGEGPMARTIISRAARVGLESTPSTWAQPRGLSTYPHCARCCRSRGCPARSHRSAAGSCPARRCQPMASRSPTNTPAANTAARRTASPMSNRMASAPDIVSVTGKHLPGRASHAYCDTCDQKSSHSNQERAVVSGNPARPLKTDRAAPKSRTPDGALTG